MLKYTVLFCILCALTSCGVTYRPLHLDTLPYQNSASLKDGVSVSYLYDIQTLSNNRRYGKKERKFGYAAIGVRIKNESTQPIQVTKDNFKVSVSGGSEKEYLPQEVYTKKVRQHPVVHLLHALWGPWRISVIDYGNDVKDTDIKYIPIGAVIGVVNLSIAASGNLKHQEALRTNTLFNKTVKPGQTINGVILLQNKGYEPLTFTLRE